VVSKNGTTALFDLFSFKKSAQPVVLSKQITGKSASSASITTFGKGSKRDFIYADDMAFSILELIRLQRSGIFNLGSGEGYSLETIANYVHKKLNGKTLISRARKKPVYDILENRVNIQKLIDSKAYKNSMNVYKYIDNVLDNIGK